MQIRNHPSEPLKCYRIWHVLLLYQILCHSDQRFLRFKLQKFEDFPIYSIAKWAGGNKLYSNMAANISALRNFTKFKWRKL